MEKNISKSTDFLEKSTTKRGSELDKDRKDSKRPKIKDSKSIGALKKSNDTNKQLFQRLWSEDDEVALLKGLISFTEKKGIDHATDMNAFYHFIKNSFHFDVSLNQLKEKVSRFKRKFENHASKGKKGEDKRFSKPHDQELFDLSKKIWGTEGLCGRSKSSLGPLKLESRFNASEMEEFVIKRRLEMVDETEKSEIEEKWRKLEMKMLELFLKRTEFVMEQGKLLLASYKKH